MENPVDPRDQAWKEWMAQPQGVLLRQYLKASQMALQAQWAAKMFMGAKRDEILILNAAALGEHQAYERILSLTFDQIIGVIEDDQDDK
jgi:hypothetical protein